MTTDDANPCLSTTVFAGKVVVLLAGFLANVFCGLAGVAGLSGRRAMRRSRVVDPAEIYIGETEDTLRGEEDNSCRLSSSATRSASGSVDWVSSSSSARNLCIFQDFDASLIDARYEYVRCRLPLFRPRLLAVFDREEMSGPGMRAARFHKRYHRPKGPVVLRVFI